MPRRCWLIVAALLCLLPCTVLFGFPPFIEISMGHLMYGGQSTNQDGGQSAAHQDGGQSSAHQNSSKTSSLQLKDGAGAALELEDYFDAAPLPRPSNYSTEDLRLIIYNVISKCGSAGVRQSLKAHCKANGIKMFSFNKRNVTNFAQSLNQVVTISEEPVLYAFHHCFVDFQKHGLVPPPHIQVIRDPVDQGVSRYQFERDIHNITDQEWGKSIVECMVNLSECPVLDAVINSSMLQFFCGAECTSPGVPANWIHFRSSREGAVEAAKRNIVRYHSVVGLTEELTGFYETLEYMHPTYFHGLTQTVQRLGKADTKVHQSINRKEWPAWVKDVLRKNRWRDIEVYKFVRKRFYKQWEEAKKARKETSHQE